MHPLSFDNPFVEDRNAFGFGSLTLEEVLQKITGNGTQNKGFLFAAHPASGGYTWEDDYYETVTDPKWGNVFAGFQFFNEKIIYDNTTSLSAGDEALEPFELLDEDSRQQPWSKELRDGLKNHWIKRFLLPPLQEYRRTGKLRKYFILAGSDAHMDFNYSLRPKIPLFLQHLTDNAFGKVRTLVYLPKQDGQALTESNLYEALRNGGALLTDGPVVLFHLKIEGEDRVYRFGETVPLPSGKNFELMLEWQSTPEFGSTQEIKLILGTPRGEKTSAIRFASPVFEKKRMVSVARSNTSLQIGPSVPVTCVLRRPPCLIQRRAKGSSGVSRIRYGLLWNEREQKLGCRLHNSVGFDALVTMPFA